MKFDAEKVKNDCVQWIKNWFEKNGSGCNAFIGISGGIDSAVVAALCVEALGKERVVGILMPNGEQSDLDDAKAVINTLDIVFNDANIKAVYNDILSMFRFTKPSEQTKINLAPRIRMTVLYAFAQSLHGRVANTCNLSESWIGYDTRWGDAAGDFAPIQMLTKTEVRELAKVLNVPEEIIEKKPADGLCGKTDEERWGFTYEMLDRHIREKRYGNESDVDRKIREMHNKNVFKLTKIPYFPYRDDEFKERFYGKY